jgi:hypothetical protein
MARATSVRSQEAHRLDRNYSELPAGVARRATGVQILFAFLFSIAFEQRFAPLDHTQRMI